MLIDCLPFTERTNPICDSLDGSLGAVKFLSNLRSCDSQIFCGYSHELCMMDDLFVRELERTAVACSDIILKSENAKIVMTGCGTSGRIAFLTARRYNMLLEEFGVSASYFGYACAGGDSALILSDELPEDDALAGVADLKVASNGSKHVMVIGVTCGMSAPYVAGQLAHILERQVNEKDSMDECGLCLLGFNPIYMARKSPIHNLPMEWKCFFDVAAAMDARRLKSSKCTILNPVVGGEPIAGSSRMKGGSATLVLLDILCLRILCLARLVPPSHPLYALASLSVLEILCEYQRVHTITYNVCGKKLCPLMESAAGALARGGHVYYVGIGSAAVVGGIDLSEMPDTYGAPFDQMRSFIHHGWETFKNAEGDLSAQSPLHKIGLDQFKSDVLPALNDNDCVICLVSCSQSIDLDALQELQHVVNAVHSLASGRIGLIHTADASSELQPPAATSILCSIAALCGDKCAVVELPCGGGFSDLSIKLMVNAISTYAQAAGRGAVFKSLMISTGPANEKIYDRCIRLIADTVKIPVRNATVALLRSVYGLDLDTDVGEDGIGDELLELLNAPKIQHIRVSLLPMEKRGETQIVLPVAFLLASQPDMSVSEARRRADAEPHIGILLRDVLHNTASDGEHQDSRVNCQFKSKFESSTEHFVTNRKEYVVGIDMGGTTMRAGAMSVVDGKLLDDIIIAKVTDRSPDGVLGLMSGLVETIRTRPSFKQHNLVAIGVGQPGFVCKDGSIKCLANYSNWGNFPVPVRSHLVGTCGCSNVYVHDDADCALAGEVQFGSGLLYRSAVMFTVGTGIGTSVMLSNGRILHGNRGLIEAGHTIVVPDPSTSVLCPCGQYGCLEMVASGTAIARAAVDRVIFDDNCTVTAERVVEACARGNRVADDILECAGKYLAVGIVNAIRHYDPSVVILAGGLGNAMYGRVCKSVSKLTWNLHKDCSDIPILLADCSQPGVLGACSMAIRGLENELESGSCVRGENGCSKKKIPFLRQAVERDRFALYNVCLCTGDAGNDATQLYSDKELLGSIYVGPYLSHSMEYAFVLDNGCGEGVGYTLGVLDTTEFLRKSEAYRSNLAAKYCIHSSSGAISEKWLNMNQIEQDLIQKEIHLAIDITRPHKYHEIYPSHLHIDIKEKYQGKGYGVAMIKRQLYALRAGGSKGVYLVQASDNARAFHFYTTKFGFETIDRLEGELVLGLKL